MIQTVKTTTQKQKQNSTENEWNNNQLITF